MGFAPRKMEKTEELDENGNTRYKYIWDEKLTGYNIILTNIAFLHRNYLSLYWSEHPLPTAFRQFVSEHTNCEDIAMNFMVAIATGSKSPIYVKSNFRVRVDARAISHQPGHNIRRSECCTLFNAWSQQHGQGAPLDSIQATWSFSHNTENKIVFIQ